MRIPQPGRSVKDLRDRNLIKQRYDFSCGAAALATILRFGFGDPVTEVDILDGLFDLPTEVEKDERRRTGFSLLDLQRVAQARGYAAEGFRLTPEQLPLMGGPVIVFIESRGYRHFAVLRGVRGDRVYLADPSRGNVRMPAYTFLDHWLQDDGRGIIFVVEPKNGPTGTSAYLALAPIRSRGGLVQPELMSAGEMLAVGNPVLRPAEGRR